MPSPWIANARKASPLFARKRPETRTTSSFPSRPMKCQTPRLVA